MGLNFAAKHGGKSDNFIYYGNAVGVGVAGNAMTTSTVLGKTDSTDILSTNGLTFGSS
jgi:hypothetical protein